jgi:hypothetical protein
VRALGPVHVEEAEFASSASKSVNGTVENSGCVILYREDSARNAALLVPPLEPEPSAPNFESELTGNEPHEFFAFFDDGRSAAGTEEVSNCGQRDFRVGKASGRSVAFIIEFCHSKCPVLRAV